MQKKSTITLRSIAAIPLLATTFLLSPLGVSGNTASALASIPTVTSLQTAAATTSQQAALSLEAAKIDAYFTKYNMPLAGYGMDMAVAAEEHNIDPYLIPASAARESTGGEHPCSRFPENMWGWGSCKIGLGGSIPAAIELMAANFGGDNPKTAKYYNGKTTEQILETYNPNSIVPGYADQVMHIMDTISKMDVPATANQVATVTSANS